MGLSFTAWHEGQSRKTYRIIILDRTVKKGEWAGTKQRSTLLSGLCAVYSEKGGGGLAKIINIYFLRFAK